MHRPFGNGPVDAVFNAKNPPDAFRMTQSWISIRLHAVTGGTDAQATSLWFRLNGEGIMATGRCRTPDTLVASAKAYLHA